LYSATIENRGDTRAFATTKNGEFVMDTADAGINPIDTLLASLAGCLNHQLRDCFTTHRIASGSFDIRVEAELTADQSRLADIAVVIALKDTVINQENEPVVMASVHACKIYQTLSANSKISVKLERRR
jgi:uncharacterized OsmC-like protein